MQEIFLQLTTPECFRKKTRNQSKTSIYFAYFASIVRTTVVAP